MSFKKNKARSPSLEMKRPREATHPDSGCISLRVLGGWHLLYGLDLFRVGLNSSVGDEEANELARQNPENTFIGVELQDTRA